MKSSILSAVAFAGLTTAVASPHRYRHQHLHKRDATITQTVAGPTAFAYVLDSNPSSTLELDEVCNGLAQHSLMFSDGQVPAGLCQSSTTVSQAAATSAASTSATASINTPAAAFYGKSSWSTSGLFSSQFSSQSSSQAPSKTQSLFSSQSPAPSTASAAASSSSPLNQGGTGVNAAFPDGQLDCSTFPSQYGAVALDYLNLGGWTGLQAVTFGQSAIDSIVTGVAGQTCSEGMMCSYACPPGYLKSQWPTMQGSSGQSVGGIQCSGGKLHLTNSGLSTSLCIPGMGGVQAQNNASGVVAICRTDYPGTESETIPVEISAGSVQPLANPDGDTYYMHEGAITSAQYYLNPIGVNAETACQWGQQGQDTGNWAPMNLGVGYTQGYTWLSIFPNAATTSVLYQGTVSIEGNDLSASCVYSNGQYCGANGCGSSGCTVRVNSGSATFIISA